MIRQSRAIACLRLADFVTLSISVDDNHAIFFLVKRYRSPVKILHTMQDFWSWHVLRRAQNEDPVTRGEVRDLINKAFHLVFEFRTSGEHRPSQLSALREC